VYFFQDHTGKKKTLLLSSLLWVHPVLLSCQVIKKLT
jgi:hypothetical protein